jgi:hypothetical protein
VSGRREVRRKHSIGWLGRLHYGSRPDIVRDIHKRLANAPDAENVRQIIITVRRHLLGVDDDLTFREIVYFQAKSSAGSSGR